MSSFFRSLISVDMVLDTSLRKEENKFGVEEPESPGLHTITALPAEERRVVRLDGVSDVGNIDPGEDEQVPALPVSELQQWTGA